MALILAGVRVGVPHSLSLSLWPFAWAYGLWKCSPSPASPGAAPGMEVMLSLT